MNARLWLAVELVAVLLAIALVALAAAPDAEEADRVSGWCRARRCEVAARQAVTP